MEVDICMTDRTKKRKTLNNSKFCMTNRTKSRCGRSDGIGAQKHTRAIVEKTLRESGWEPDRLLRE